jgi:putative SOS response-associated peptidase YedK
MCTRYVSPEAADMERFFQLRKVHPWSRQSIFPRSRGPFIRAARDDVANARALVIGQWGLVPWFATSARLKFSTNNARSEELERKPTFKPSWARGQRCIVPAESFDEPNWETGRNVWWRFRRADGAPWALAGLWNTWTDPTTGELVESYTMLTMNADRHPLMSRMHKPDPASGPDAQDKRSVVVLELSEIDRWLHGSAAEARTLIRLTPVETFIAGPVDAADLAGA